MLQDIIDPPEVQLSIEGISSPIASQIFDFQDEHGMDFLDDALHISDVSSCSPNNIDNVIVTTTPAPITITTDSTATVGSCDDSEGLRCLFDNDPHFDFDPDAISTLLDSSSHQPSFDATSTYQELPAGISGYTQIQHHQNLQDNELNNQLLPTDATTSTTMSSSQQWPRDSPDSVIPFDTDIDVKPGWVPWSCQQAPPPSDSAVLSFLAVGPRQVPSSLIGGGYVGGMDILPSSRAAAFLNANIISRYQSMMNMRDGQLGFFHDFRPESTQRVFGSTDMQVMGDYNSLVEGSSSSTTTSTQLPTSEMPTLDDSTLKISRLSAEERQEKIHRYLKKRTERNFNKKIKYACRKTLADSRPRVRGRFAKNDEHGEATARPSSSNHEYYDEEEVMVKEEDMLNSSDIVAHISGFTNFNYNYSHESWI